LSPIHVRKPLIAENSVNNEFFFNNFVLPPTDSIILNNDNFVSFSDVCNVYNMNDDILNVKDFSINESAVEPESGASVAEDGASSAESIKNISVYYQNVNRARTKTAELFLTVIEHDYDVIILVETNFETSINSEEVFDSRYIVYRCDRILNVNSIKSSGGGVVVAVKKHFRSVVCSDLQNSCEEIWVKICFEDTNLFVCGVYLPHSVPDDFCQRHMTSVEKISADATLTDLMLVCGDFNLTDVGWVVRDDELCPINVISVRESIIVDGMSGCDLSQMNNIPNQYGVYLDLVFFNNPSMLTIREAETPILTLDRHHPAFVLDLKIEYLKYATLSNHVSRFNFKKANMEAISSKLLSVSVVSFL